MSWNSIGLVDSVSQNLLEKMHTSHYQQASHALAEQIVMPDWDEMGLCASDIPDFDVSMRNYKITRNPVFPLFWRIRANSSFLPLQLGDAYKLWKTWITEVNQGKHDDYLKELHLYETCCLMKEHWSYLRNQVLRSVSQNTKWVDKTEEIRKKILILSEPKIPKIRLEPTEDNKKEITNISKQYTETFSELERLIQYTKLWNSEVPSKWKVCYNNRNYNMSLDHFKGYASADFISDLFAWLDRCVVDNFGVFLHY